MLDADDGSSFRYCCAIHTTKPHQVVQLNLNQSSACGNVPPRSIVCENLWISARTKETRCPIEISFYHQRPRKLGCAKPRTPAKTVGISSKHIPTDRSRAVI